jgi:hypothetical protein
MPSTTALIPGSLRPSTGHGKGILDLLGPDASMRSLGDGGPSHLPVLISSFSGTACLSDAHGPVQAAVCLISKRHSIIYLAIDMPNCF